MGWPFPSLLEAAILGFQSREASAFSCTDICPGAYAQLVMLVLKGPLFWYGLVPSPSYGSTYYAAMLSGWLVTCRLLWCK
ncbi:hypothetical protein DFP73DRAFT_544445 [Morchella snyderi]|nr:hypothetical protein DFP73DRAFT_544445 [Morchella snyderi]